MSEQVDTRIVEMQFDDSQFKTGIKDAITSIKKLDSALELEKGASGFEKVYKEVQSFNLSDIGESVENIGGKFSKLREVAVNSINAIGSVMKGGLISGGVISALTALPVVAKSISGGMSRAANLAQAEFQFEGLGVSGGKLATLMERVSASVNDTAYGLDQASKVASMLFASGVQDVDKLGHALDNVANVAATFNADYNTIADVMTKVASKGRMQGEEFNRLAYAGMNAKSMIAEFLQTERGASEYSGLVEKFGDTEAAVDQMSQKGVISFDLLVDAMDKFTGNAQKSNETLSGVMANIGSALSRTTGDFFQYVLQDKNGVVKLLNSVRVAINNFNKATSVLMHDVAKDADGNVTHMGVVLQGVIEVINEVQRVFGYFNEFGRDENGVSYYFRDWAETFQEIAPAIEKFFSRLSSIAYRVVSILFRITEVVRDLGRIFFELFEPIAKAFDEVFGDYIIEVLHGIDDALVLLDKKFQVLSPTESMTEGIYNVFKKLFEVLKVVADVVGGVLIDGFYIFVAVGELVYAVFELVVEVVSAFFEAISPVTDVIAELFGVMSNQSKTDGQKFTREIRKITDKIGWFAQNVKSSAENVKEFFEPLAEWAKEAAGAIRDSGFLDFVKDAIPKGVEALGSALSNFIPMVKELYDFLSPIGEAFGDVFGKTVDNIRSFVESPTVTNFFEGITSGISDFLGIEKAFADTGESAEESSKGIDAFGERFGEAAVAARDGAIDLGGRALDALVEIATAVWNTVGPALEWLFDLIEQVGGIIMEAFSNSGLTWDPVIEFFEKVGELASDFFKLFEDGVPSLEDFGKFFREIGEAAGQMMDDVVPKFGSMMEEIGEQITNQVDGPLGTLVEAVGSVIDNVGKFPELLGQIPSGFGSLFDSIFNGLDAFIRNPLGVEKAWASTGEDSELSGPVEAFDQMEDDAITLSGSIDNIVKFLKTPFKTIRKVVGEGFSGMMKGIGDAIQGGLSSINFETIMMFIENLKNVAVTFSSLWGTIVLVSVFESIRKIFAGISKWTTSIDSAIQSFGNIGKAISEMFTAIGDTIKNIGEAVQKDMAANRFLKYMLATIAMIGTVVAAVIVLGKQPEAELQRGGIAILQIMLVLLLYQFLMSLIMKLNKEQGLSGAASLSGLTGMGFALLMIAKAIKNVGEIPEKQLERGGKAIGILMIILGAMAAVVGKLAENGIKGAILLVSFAAVLNLLVSTITNYNKLKDDEYENGMLRILGVLALMVIAALIISGAEGMVLKAAGAVLILAVALNIVATAIGLLNVVTGGDLGQAAISAVILIGSMLGLAGALRLLSAFEGSLIKSAIAIGLLTTCMVGIALAITMLNLATLGNPEIAIKLGGLLVGMFFVMARSLSLLGNHTRQLPNATKAIFNMTIAISAITGCIAILTGLAVFDLGAMLWSAGVVLALMFGLAGSIILIGRFGENIAQAIPAIWNMTLAILAIGAAISAMVYFTNGNNESLLIAGLMLATTLIAMAAAILILSNVGPQMTMAATSMLELAAAIAVIAVSVALLGSLGLGEIIQGFIGLIAVVVLLGVAAAAVTALSEVFIVFDGVVLVLAVAVVAIAAAFYLFVEALTHLGRIAPETFQSIIDSKDLMIEAFGAMGEAMAAAIISFFTSLVTRVGEGLVQMADEVNNHTDDIAKAAASIGHALVSGIIAGLGGLVVGVGSAIGEGITGAIDFVGGLINGSGKEIGDNIAEGVSNSDQYQNAGDEAMEQITASMEASDAPEEAGEEIVGQVDESMLEAAKQVDSSEMMANMLDGIEIPEETKNQISGMVDPSQFEGLGLDLGNMIPENIVSGASASPIDPSSLLSGMNLTTASFDKDASDVGKGIGNAVSSGAATTMSDASPVNAAIDAQISTIQGRSDDYRSSGDQSGQAYSQAVGTGIVDTDIAPSIAVNTSKMEAALQPAREAGNDVGRAYSKGEMNGISALASEVASSARRTIREAGEDADGYAAGYDPGKDFSSGMAKGITVGGKAVAKAARRIVNDAMEAAKEEADSHSPSRKMMEQGRWFGEGFAIGITQVSDLVNQNASSMAMQAMGEVEESFGVMDEIMDLIDWDARPTISPVLDLTDYEAGVRRMNLLDVQSSVDRVGWSNRVYSTHSDGSISPTAGNHIEVHLDWRAGATPNQMVQLLANELSMYELTKG